jgi:colanic acid/amylovoran biosynthesis glycosyltransferase
LTKNRIAVMESVNVWLPLTQRWIYNHLKHLPEYIEPSIVCYSTENLDEFTLPHINSWSNELKIEHLFQKLLKKVRLWHFSNYLIDIADKYNANILHSHFGNIGWENIGVATKKNLKHIVTFYGFDIGYLPQLENVWYRRYEELFSSVNLILCEGQYMSNTIKQLGCPNEKMRILHLGVSVDQIPFIPREWKPENALKILIAASFQEKKGIPYALEAIGMLQHEMDLIVTIIGDANEEQKSQREKDRIFNMIKKHNLSSKVRFLGYQPYNTLMEEAYKHHIFLSPSITADDGDSEGGVPVTIIEMAATGMLVVSTKHCDIPEVIYSGKTGLLSEEKDANGLAQHIRWLAANFHKWTSIAQNSRAHIEKQYNVAVQAGKLGQIYQELMEYDR